ncbi:hypothetical protein ACX93W_26200 [Paenibacillus sp. CAU 1782]
MEPIKVDSHRKYWLIRTRGGKLYDIFSDLNFIAIGWDKITTVDGKPDVVINEIKNAYKNEAHPKYAYNQMNRFINDLSIGDVVLIPSASSQEVRFGIITSDVFLYKGDDKISAEETLVKRRKVKWVKEPISRGKLDPNLYWLFQSHHIVSNIDNYSTYIDKTIHSFFIKGDQGHLVLNVEKETSISPQDFFDLTGGLNNIINIVNRINKTEYTLSDLEQKSNIQSPGNLEYIGDPSLITHIGLIISLISKRSLPSYVANKSDDNALIYDAEDLQMSYAKALKNVKVTVPTDSNGKQ